MKTYFMTFTKKYRVQVCMHTCPVSWVERGEECRAGKHPATSRIIYLPIKKNVCPIYVSVTPLLIYLFM